jgi:hypothetical protein
MEADPWALEAQPSGSIAPECQHGQMTRKTGLKKNGDPYAGWTCGAGGVVTSVPRFGTDRNGFRKPFKSKSIFESIYIGLGTSHPFKNDLTEFNYDLAGLRNDGCI